MEFTDGLMEENTMDSGKSIIMMVMDISKLQMAHNIIHSGRMVNEMETQF
jgi:hypothetical protein